MTPREFEARISALKSLRDDITQRLRSASSLPTQAQLAATKPRDMREVAETLARLKTASEASSMAEAEAYLAEALAIFKLLAKA